MSRPLLQHIRYPFDAMLHLLRTISSGSTILQDIGEYSITLPRILLTLNPVPFHQVGVLWFVMHKPRFALRSQRFAPIIGCWRQLILSVHGISSIIT